PEREVAEVDRRQRPEDEEETPRGVPEHPHEERVSALYPRAGARGGGSASGCRAAASGEPPGRRCGSISVDRSGETEGVGPPGRGHKPHTVRSGAPSRLPEVEPALRRTR